MNLLVDLFFLSLFTLAGFGISGILVMRAQKRRTRLRARLATTSTMSAAPARQIAPLIHLRTQTQQTQPLAAQLAQMFGIRLERREQYPVRWWLIIAITCGIGWLVGVVAQNIVGPPGLIGWPVAWVIVSRSLFSGFDSRRKEALFKQFPEALAMIVRSVRAGIPVSEAIRAVARESPQPTGQEFQILVSEISIGTPMTEALRAMAERNDLVEYRFFATTLALQSQTGGGLSETLENLADVIRKRVAMKARGHALAAEARTSAGVLAVLPVLTGLALWALNPAYFSLLFTDKMGHRILYAAGLSLGVGIWVMRTMIRRSLA
jgi:tight adherence protein B